MKSNSLFLMLALSTFLVPLAFADGVVDCSSLLLGAVKIQADGKVVKSYGPNSISSKIWDRVEMNSTSVWIRQKSVTNYAEKLAGITNEPIPVVISLDDQGRATQIEYRSGWDPYKGAENGKFSVSMKDGKCIATRFADIERTEQERNYDEKNDPPQLQREQDEVSSSAWAQH